MDLRNMLNEDSVEPTTRRFSVTEESVSGRHDSLVSAREEGSLARHDSTFSRAESTASMSGKKRSRSPSDVGLPRSDPSPKRPKARRPRPTEVPMWARKWTRDWQQQNGGKSNGYIVKHAPPVIPKTHTPMAAPAHPPPPQTSSPAAMTQRIPVRPSTAATEEAPQKEATYKNIEPLDELSKVVMDFIYEQIIKNGLIDNPGRDTEIEIEAKLGTLIDKETDARVARIPVFNECAVNDWNMPLAFKSSMTDEQHQRMNNELNTAVQASRVAGSGRVKMGYTHLYERDTFFQLPKQFVDEMPPLVRSRVMQMRNKPNVRQTVNSKTGETKIAIIKIRMADLHIFSPMTMFDWRISISLEMKFPGNVSSLEPATDSGRAKAGRNKDRLSYEHQGIKIDLTQVTMDKEKEHELEFELPTDVLRDEVRKLKAQKDNNYSGLIRNFVDDIRIATRSFPIA